MRKSLIASIYVGGSSEPQTSDEAVKTVAFSEEAPGGVFRRANPDFSSIQKSRLKLELSRTLQSAMAGFRLGDHQVAVFSNIA